MGVKGNQNNLKHGGAAAIKRLQDGKPFTGLAKAAQDDVIERLQDDGPQSFLTLNAIRAQAASELYWPVFVKTLQEGDIDKATGYLAKWGWLNTNASRAWLDVLKMMPPDDDTGITEILAKYRTPSTSPVEGENDPNN